MKKIIPVIVLLMLLFLNSFSQEKVKEQQPVAWWKFDSINNNKLIDDISTLKDTLIGYQKLVKGVTGNCLKFDGYTTKVVRKLSEAPLLVDGLSIESWIALQALPWNWSAIVSQGGNSTFKEKLELSVVDLNNLSTGLIGVQYGNADLTDPLGKQEFLSTDNDWTGSMNNWSNKWRGYIEAPFTGEVHFRAKADDGLQLIIGNNKIINGWEVGGQRTGSLNMVKGEKYPVILTYGNDGGEAILRLFWSWPAQKEMLIPIEAFGYSEKENLQATNDIILPKPPAPEYEQKIFFGVDAYGHLGFKLNLNDELYECISEKKLPLLKWSHVAATFDGNEGMKIFINGELAAELEVQGKITPVGGSDLLLGMNIENLGPEGSERQASANIHSNMVIYGLLDEIKIYDQALTEDYIKESFETEKPFEIQPLNWNKMPSGPAILENKFDAFYTRLNYTDEWEAPWRISDYPDILIHFDNLPVRFIFWRGTSYGGAWVSENGLWMGDQSLERSNKGKSPMGCSEHMSDKQTRYSSVRIIERNDARIVIQWRYAVSDIIYDIFGTDRGSGWGEWADEYYYIYPDGVSTRHQTLWTDYLSHEWQETIVLNHPGTSPDDNIDIDAMTLVSMNGDSRTYSWKDGPPKSFPEPKNINIQMVNLKSQYKPFIIFEPNPKIKPFSGSVRMEYAHFPWWNHWPVAQLPNDGRKAFGPDRASHSSLSQSIEGSEVIHNNGDGSYAVVTLVGMSDKPAASLSMLAKSWNNAPDLIINSNEFTGESYSKKERAFILSNKNEMHPSELEFVVRASNASPLLNPSFVIKNWGDNAAELSVNGKKMPRGKSFRYDHRKTMNGTDLIFWIELKSETEVSFILTPLK
ncbi:MAG TPA: LamG-like jellyroll fold domain-containing protein [Bacteroidales bacterium]|nr:LamG-like jellyroll fold domain-containing protein [Bacteroidales bacterium]